MASFTKNLISNPGKIFETSLDVVEGTISSVGDILSPDIEIPDYSDVEDEVVDPQEEVIDAAEKRRATVKAQQAQSTLLTGGSTSLLG